MLNGAPADAQELCKNSPYWNYAGHAEGPFLWRGDCT